MIAFTQLACEKIAAAIEYIDECECGEPKAHDAKCCERCNWLDGESETPLVRRMISALRVSGGIATAPELALELGVKPRSICEYMSRIKKSGRFVRVSAGYNSSINKRYNDPGGKDSGEPAVYALVECWRPELGYEPW